jgi:hypothetical protein
VANTLLRTGALSKQTGPAALTLPRLLPVFAWVPGALLLAGQAAAQCTPAAAQDLQPGDPVRCICRIGPVTAEVLVCEIKIQSFDGERQDYVGWKNEKGIWHHITVNTPRCWRGVKGYFNRWRHHHKCTAEQHEAGEPSRFEGPAGLGDIPPQVTWTGCCAAPGCYTARAIAVGNQVVELHAGIGLKLDPAPEQVFASLIDRVRLTRPLSQ